MKKLFGAIVLGMVALFTWACDPNAAGGTGDRQAARVAASLGLSPDDFRRASADEIEDRMSRRWRSGSGNLEFGKMTIDGEENTFFVSRSQGVIGKYETEGEVVFRVIGVNDDGTLSIQFVKGEVCLQDKQRCSKSRSGHGKMTMYLSDERSRDIGLFISYRTRGAEMRLDSSSYYSGVSDWDFGGVLSRF